MRKIAWIFLGWIALLTAAHAASFDCGKASSKTEKLICGDDTLSKLDDDLNKAYLHSLERSDVKQQAIESQRQWLRKERNVCQNTECIKAAYETRIKELGFTSSFGIVFSRPSVRSTSPPQAPVKLPESQVVMQPVGTSKIQIVQQQISVSAADCDTSAIKGLERLPEAKAVTHLVEISNIQHGKQQFECAVQALEQAGRVIRTVDDGAERAVMRFEIKDAVFSMVQQGILSDPSLEKRAILAAIQSIDANGALIKAASEDEHFNDAAFFGRLADYYREHHRDDDYRQASSMMFRVDFTLPANRRFVEPWPMHQYLNVLANKFELLEMAYLLELAPDDRRGTLEKDMANAIHQPINNYVLIGVNLLAYDKAKQNIEALSKLQPAIERMKSSQSDFWVWPIYRYMAEAYWQSGDKEKAREMLSKARASILSAKSYPKGSSTALEYLATSLCKLIRGDNGKVGQMCPIGIYDAKEMAALLDEVEQVAKLASDPHALGTAGVLRKRLPQETVR